MVFRTIVEAHLDDVEVPIRFDPRLMPTFARAARERVRSLMRILPETLSLRREPLHDVRGIECRLEIEPRARALEPLLDGL